MDWQTMVTLAAVALAGAYLGWRGMRLWRGTGKFGGSCACPPRSTDSKAPLIASEDLVIRRKR